MKRWSAAVMVVALLLAAVAMVAQSGSLQHLHMGPGAGLFNEEHDLTLLASLAGHGVVAAATPAVAFDIVSAPVPASIPDRPTAPVASSGDSRAPPSA